MNAVVSPSVGAGIGAFAAGAKGATMVAGGANNGGSEAAGAAAWFFADAETLAVFFCRAGDFLVLVF